MTGKTSGDARRRSLLAAVSILGVSLGMASAHADTPNSAWNGGVGDTKPTTQVKTITPQTNVKTSNQLKIESNQLKTSNQLKGQNSIKDSTQVKTGAAPQ